MKTCQRGPCRECPAKHNTLCRQPLGDKASASLETKGQQNEITSESANSLTVHHSYGDAKGRRILMATAMVEATQRNGWHIPIRLLLDSASEANFITQSAHNKLGLKRNRVAEVVTGLNEMENKIHSRCEVHFKSKCSTFEINAQCLVVPRITKNLPSMQIDRSKLQIPNNLYLADEEFHKIGPIDMLLGAEFFFDLLETGKIELGKNQVVLQNTKFGWVVAGFIPSTILEGLEFKPNISSLICSVKSGETLSENLERFWKTTTTLKSKHFRVMKENANNSLYKLLRELTTADLSCDCHSVMKVFLSVTIVR